MKEPIERNIMADVFHNHPATKGKLKVLLHIKRKLFFICFHCQKSKHREEECLYKDKPFLTVTFAKKLGHGEKVLQLEKTTWVIAHMTGKIDWTK